MFPPTSSNIRRECCLFLSLLAWVAAKLLVRRYETSSAVWRSTCFAVVGSALKLLKACTLWRSTGLGRLPPTVFSIHLLLLLSLFLPPGKTQSVPRSVFPFPYALPWACEVRSTTGDPSSVSVTVQGRSFTGER